MTWYAALLLLFLMAAGGAWILTAFQSWKDERDLAAAYGFRVRGLWERWRDRRRVPFETDWVPIEGEEW